MPFSRIVFLKILVVLPILAAGLLWGQYQTPDNWQYWAAAILFVGVSPLTFAFYDYCRHAE